MQIEKTDSSQISCSGKEAPYDHPKIYLEINKAIGEINCPYCNKKFQLTKVT